MSLDMHLKPYFLSVYLLIISSTLQANLIQDAEQAIDNKEFSTAIIHLKNQLKKTPDNVQARFLLGEIYLHTGKLNYSIKELKHAHKYAPNNVQIIFLYADALLAAGKQKKVISLLNAPFSDKQQESQRLSYLGHAYAGLKQLPEAKKMFNEAKQLHDNVVAFNGLARIALIEKKYEMANELIIKSLKIEPEKSETLKIKAKILTINKQYDKSLEIYNKLLEEDNNDVILYVERAGIKLILNEIKDAEKDLIAAIKKVKFQPQANYLLAQIKLQELKYDEAIAAAQKVLKILPDNAQSKLILAVANLLKGNYRQAEGYLLQYLSSDPNNINAQALLANVYLGQKKNEQAVLMLEGIPAEQRDQSPRILTLLGSAYLLIGEHKKGLNILSKVQDIDNNPYIQKMIISGQFQSNNINEAITGLEQIVETNTASSKAAYLLIVSYIQQQQLDKAESKILELLVLTPNDKDLYNLQAVVKTMRGRNQEAKIAYKKAMEIDDKYIAAYMGLGMLAIKDNNLEEAKNIFKQILLIDIKFLKAYFSLAYIADKQQSAKEAEQQLLAGFNNMTEVKEKISAATMLSKWYKKNGQNKKTLFVAKKLVSFFPDNNESLSFLAAAQIFNKQEKRAITTLYKIIRNDEEDKKHRIMLANLLSKHGYNDEEVLILLDKVIYLGINDPGPYLIKATYLISIKRFNEALSIAQKLKFDFPDLSIGEQIEGDIYLAQKKFHNAISSYKFAYQRQPNNKLLMLIVDLTIKQGRTQQAIDFLRETLNRDPDNIIAHFKIATIFENIKANKEAIKHYQIILNKKDDHLIALNNLAMLLLLENNPLALDLSRKAYEIAPESSAISDTYGLVLIKQGSIAEGVKILEKAVKLSPAARNIQYHLADAYYLNGNMEYSKNILEKLLRSEKYFSEKKNATDLLNKINSRN